MKRESANTTEVLEFDDNAEWIGATIIVEKQSAAGNILIYLICCAIVFSTLAFGMVDGWSLAVFTLGAGAVGWLWLADAWQTGALKFSRSLLPLPIFGLILVGLIQLLPLRALQLPEHLINLPINSALSLDAFATRLAIVQLCAMLIFFAAALVYINNPKSLRVVTSTIVIFGFLLAVFGIIQHFSGEGKIYWLREPVQQNPFASFVNRHHFGACMEMTIALTLGMIYSGAVEREKRFLHIFAVVIMGIGLILTGSRGALLSLLVLIAFLSAATYFQRRKDNFQDAEGNRGKSALSSRLTLFGGALLLIFVIFGAVLFLGNEAVLLRGIGVSGGAGDTSSGRLQFWQTTWQMVADYPLLGVGLNGFGVAYTRYDTANGIYRLEQAHNDYLQVLAEAGVVGLSLILIFIWLLFRRGLQVFMTTRDNFRRGACIGALAGCFGVIIHSFFDFPLRTPSNLLLFFIFAALATAQITHPKIYRPASQSNKN